MFLHRTVVRAKAIAVAGTDVGQVDTRDKADGGISLLRQFPQQARYFIDVGAVSFPVFQGKRAEQRHDAGRGLGMRQKDRLKFDGVFFAVAVFPGQKVAGSTLQEFPAVFPVMG